MKQWLKENLDPAMVDVLAFFGGLAAMATVITVVVVICKIALYQWGGG